METDGRLYLHGGRVRCREGHYVLPRPSGLLAVSPGRPVCDLLSRRCPRPTRRAWHLEKGNREDRDGLNRLSYRCEPTVARAIESTRFCSSVSDAKNSRTNKTPSAAPNVRPNVRFMAVTPPQGFTDWRYRSNGHARAVRSRQVVVFVIHRGRERFRVVSLAADDSGDRSRVRRLCSLRAFRTRRVTRCARAGNRPLR